jgi:NUMOD4 motif
MDEIWKVIEDIPSYEVSNQGHVRRVGRTEPLSMKRAKGDALFVTMVHKGERYSRSVKVLVANAFVPIPEGWDPDIFDTPIQCTMNTDIINADIIKWRPRWFAIKYRKQYREELHPNYTELPVVNLDTRNEHASILSASLRDGVLMFDIFRSAGEGYKVFPLGYHYEFLFRLESNLRSVHNGWV